MEGASIVRPYSTNTLLYRCRLSHTTFRRQSSMPNIWLSKKSERHSKALSPFVSQLYNSSLCCKWNFTSTPSFEGACLYFALLRSCRISRGYLYRVRPGLLKLSYCSKESSRLKRRILNLEGKKFAQFSLARISRPAPNNMRSQC